MPLDIVKASFSKQWCNDNTLFQQCFSYNEPSTCKTWVKLEGRRKLIALFKPMLFSTYESHINLPVKRIFYKKKPKWKCNDSKNSDSVTSSLTAIFYLVITQQLGKNTKLPHNFLSNELWGIRATGHWLEGKATTYWHFALWWRMSRKYEGQGTSFLSQNWSI